MPSFVSVALKRAVSWKVPCTKRWFLAKRRARVFAKPSHYLVQI